MRRKSSPSSRAPRDKFDIVRLRALFAVLPGKADWLRNFAIVESVVLNAIAMKVDFSSIYVRMILSTWFPAVSQGTMQSRGASKFLAVKFWVLCEGVVRIGASMIGARS